MNLIVKLVPDDFDVPRHVTGPGFSLRPLGVADLEADYAALMANADHLSAQRVFGPEETWPIGITKAENLADLGWHEVEFRLRSSFAYLVSDADQKYAGCVYIFSSLADGFDAEVFFWTTEAAEHAGLFDALRTFIGEWIGTEWPFVAPLYPGRSVSWADYAVLPKRTSASIKAVSVSG